MTDVLQVDPHHPDARAVARAADCLRAGGLVAFPTETVYGLGVHALDPAAVRRLFAAKGRPTTDPLIVHVLSLEDARSLVRAVPDAATRLAARFWPGPLTMVMPRAEIVPNEVTAGLDTVAIRVPAHPVAQALLAQAKIPVAAPSANQFSRPSPTRAEHVLEDLAGRIDLILDGGPTRVGIESTVVDLSQGAPTILRPGGVTTEMLREVLTGLDVTIAAHPSGPMRSPGLLEKHYSPRAALTLYEGPRAQVLERMAADAQDALARGVRVAAIVAEGDVPRLGDVAAADASRWQVRSLGREDDLAAVAARLYDTLRELDIQADVMLVRGFPAEFGLGAAIQDRLRRAAAGRIVRC